MANQRKAGIARVTVTLPDEMLEDVERRAKASGIDRLELMRAAIRHYITQPPTQKREAKGKRDAK